MVAAISVLLHRRSLPEDMLLTQDSSARLFLRIYFPDGQRIGPGKILLLETLRTHGSILGAAKAIGMSYRRAWMLTDEMNRMFTQKVIITHPGRRGAGTEVTEFGERLISLYREMEIRSMQANQSMLDELIAGLADPTGITQAALEPEPEKAG